MATEVVMPQMGFDMKEGTVVRWIKREGDAVNKGEPLAEIETDKAVVEVEAFATGVLRKISVPEGTTVPVGQVIGVIAEPGEAVAETPAPAKAGGAASAPAPASRAAADAPAPPARAATATPQRTAAPAAEDGRIKASPLARKEAETRGIDLAQITGTGPGGRITRDDVLAFKEKPAAAPAPAPARAPAATPAPARAPAPALAAPVLKEELVPLSKMRQAIAGAMARSMREIPHFYVTVEIDMTKAMALRSEINKGLEAEKLRISVNDMIILACAKALKKHPHFNASYTEKGVQIHGQVNISVAVAVENGLVAPSITDAASKSLSEIARASAQLIERARSGVLTASEYTGGTFSVSNLGMFGVEDFTAIITPPQAGVLAVGAVKKTPIVREGQVAIIDAMKATLSTDHRVADGAQSARFLADIRALLENPLLLLV